MEDKSKHMIKGRQFLLIRRNNFGKNVKIFDKNLILTQNKV